MGSSPVAPMGGLLTDQNLSHIQIACQEDTESAKEALHQPPVEAATMARSPTAPVGELLTDKNYKNWSACMKNYLVGEDLWDVIVGSADKDEIDGWNRRNAKALHAIQISCKEDKLSIITCMESAKEAWDKLAEKANEGPAPEPVTYAEYQPLFKAVAKGDKNKVKQFIESHRQALSAPISNDGNTMLIDAAIGGYVEIVTELVNMMSAEDLEVKDNDGFTGLSAAAQVGMVKMAQVMVQKNPKLVSIRNKEKLLPVVIAAQNGHEKMTRYLYSVTPFGDTDEYAVYDVRLLNCCITSGWFDIALNLVHRRRDLAITSTLNGFSGLLVMAGTPFAFPSSRQLVFWKRFIYSRITVHDYNSLIGDLESFGNGHTAQMNKPRKVLNQLEASLWNILKHIVPPVKLVHDEKLIHKQAAELLFILCDEISNLDQSKYHELGVYKALFRATKNGLEEVVREIVQCHPYVLWGLDDQGRNVFSYSVAKREEKVFNYLNNLGTRKHVLALNVDYDSNTMLHVAARLPPIQRLEEVSGAALQMQRELQWFEVVKNAIQPNLRRLQNNDGKTPDVLFTEEHRNLVEQGEAWVKNTATSSTVVAALIATIMFAAAFTVPGGYDSNGTPTYLHRKSFSIFVISDALSLFLSSSSVLVFLGILTSRYKEEDFLKSVPTKLIIGLTTLFFSIAAMMVNFGSTLVIMLNRRWEWIPIPIMLLSSVPVTLFALLQFPLLVEVLLSTYGAGIFYNSSNTDG